MGFWSRIFGGEAKSTSTEPSPWFVDWIKGGHATLSGQHVSPDSAMRLSAVWACVRVRSEDVGKLPCILYRRTADGGKERATKHDLYSLIRDRPNPRQTAFEFRQMMQAQKDLRGNAYALKEFDGRGKVVALWPINPEYVTVLQTPDGRELFYRITIPGQEPDTFPGEGIVHLRGLSLDGKIGLSPIGYHRETIGLALAAEKYGAAFFGNSAQPRGGIELPNPISAEAAEALRNSWEKKYRGAEKSNKIAIFDGGMKYVQTGMNNNDAQYLETRSFQNREIWRIYRMPPHKVGDLDKATNNNIEHQGLEYVTDCLMSELVSWEQTLKRDLLSEAEQKDYFFEFLVDALLRGDLKSRFEAYAIARNWGLFSANDCLDRENMNRIPNGGIYLQPLNMVEAGTKPPPIAAPVAPSELPPPSPGGAKYLLALAQQLVAADDARESTETHDDE